MDPPENNFIGNRSSIAADEVSPYPHTNAKNSHKEEDSGDYD